MKQAKGKESTKDHKAAQAYQNRARRFGNDGAGSKSMMDRSYMQLRRRPQRCLIEHEHESFFTKLAESSALGKSIAWY